MGANAASRSTPWREGNAVNPSISCNHPQPGVVLWFERLIPRNDYCYTVNVLSQYRGCLKLSGAHIPPARQLFPAMVLVSAVWYYDHVALARPQRHPPQPAEVAWLCLGSGGNLSHRHAPHPATHKTGRKPHRMPRSATTRGRIPRSRLSKPSATCAASCTRISRWRQQISWMASLGSGPQTLACERRPLDQRL